MATETFISSPSPNSRIAIGMSAVAGTERNAFTATADGFASRGGGAGEQPHPHAGNCGERERDEPGEQRVCDPGEEAALGDEVGEPLGDVDR